MQPAPMEAASRECSPWHMYSVWLGLHAKALWLQNDFEAGRGVLHNKMPSTVTQQLQGDGCCHASHKHSATFPGCGTQPAIA